MNRSLSLPASGSAANQGKDWMVMTARQKTRNGSLPFSYC